MPTSPGTPGANPTTTTAGAPLSAPVRLQTMDRMTGIGTSIGGPSDGGGSGSAISRPGALRPPNELGRQEDEESPNDGSNNNHPNNHHGQPKHKFSTGIHPRSAAARKRSMAAIQCSMTQAASASSAKAVAASKEKTKTDDPSMICSLTYRGMEVVFASTHSPKWCIYGICARTRLVFQTLDLPTAMTNTPTHLPKDNQKELQIVSVMSNQTSGLLAVAMSDGTVQTYTPVPTDPAIHPFGRFRWINGATIRCSRVFYQSGEPIASKKMAQPGEAIVMASSRDQKLLVAHRNQLAVFDVNTDVTASTSSRSGRSNGSNNHNTIISTASSEEMASTQEGRPPPVAQLLWITSVADPIITASISGDGQSLAVVTSGGTPGVYDTTCGVRIFVRDMDDGARLEETAVQEHQAQTTSKATLQRKVSVGILYKLGPFLEHSEPVTRISFRGLGHNTASVLVDDEQGNDLLLTYSKHDGMARIFNQHGWNQLVEWNTPPNSRVDWVKGAAAFSLGDLETQKRLVPKTDSNPPSRSPSSQGLAEQANIGTGFLQGGRQLLHNTSPSTAAGAWIAETTFCGAIPALRLSRLSFLKRGSETMHPAMFESVASILPSGSMLPETVLNSDDESLSIHGIWPAWNPWLSETSDAHSEDTLRGSAMAFLGLSSGPSAASGGNFGEGILGGTHSPPNELRILASHSLCGNVVIMEFPLWGNKDLGELELGSTIRYMLSLPDIEQAPSENDDVDDGVNDQLSPLSDSTDYESNRLVARLRPDGTSIALTWQKQGTMSICPASWEPQDYENALGVNIFAQSLTGEIVGIAERFRDCSLMPAPLSLPPIFIPRGVLSRQGESIQSILWWPDENFGAPPLLVVITSSGTLLVFEVPPPWSALEPPMPDVDPFLDYGDSIEGVDSVDSVPHLAVPGTTTGEDSDDDGWVGQREYDVFITPDPDFGLGLRLESQVEGMPAVAGSYKKHPLTGGRLPAEKIAMIVLGDELLSVNGVRLEGISFEQIISTVREVGSTAGPSHPICMRFRHVGERRRKENSDLNRLSVEIPSMDGSRHSVEQMLDVSTGLRPSANAGTSSNASASSILRRKVSKGRVDGELQQEFCRVVAIAKNLFPSDPPDPSNGSPVGSSFVLLPWTSGVGAPMPLDLRGAALLFLSEGSRIYARRIEVSADCSPDNTRAVSYTHLTLPTNREV